MTQPYVIGAFVGGADTGGFAAAYQRFEALMGAPPTIVNTYIDGTQQPPFAGSVNYGAGTFNQSGLLKNVVPMMGLPMSATLLNDAGNLAYLQAIAAGQYDSVIAAYVTTWKNVGYTTQIWRPGVEMNLVSTPGNYVSSQAQAAWIAAFRRIYTVLHESAAANGCTVTVVWNPGCVNGTPAGNATQTMYPGAAYVDVIGGDYYDNCGYCYPPYTAASLMANPQLLVAFYQNPAMQGPSATAMPTVLDGSGGVCLSVPSLAAFARQQNKPFALCEVGAGSGPTDNPWFWQWLRGVLDAHVEAGGTVAFVSLWDENDGSNGYQFSGGQQPNAAAAVLAAFGPNASAVPSVAPAVVTPTVKPNFTASPAGTQISGTTGTITDTAGTIWAINGNEQITHTFLGQPLTVEETSANVVTLFWTGSELAQLNSGGNWWTQPLAGGAGSPIGAPAGYVAPVPAFVVSPNNTLIGVGNGTITDSAGNQWIVQQDGQIAFTALGANALTVVNSSMNVDYLFWNGELTQLNSSGEFWQQPLSNNPGTLVGTPSGFVHPASPAGTQINGSGALYDASGNAWSLSGGVVSENGTPVAGSVGVECMVWTGSEVALLGWTAGGSPVARPSNFSGAI